MSNLIVSCERITSVADSINIFSMKDMAQPSAAANALDQWFNICTAISMCEVLLHLNGVDFDMKFGRRSRGRSDPSCSPGCVRGCILWLC